MQYKRGQPIYIGFGDPGYQNDALIPCPFCPAIVESYHIGCNICGGCKNCITVTRRAKEDRVPLDLYSEVACDHKFIIDACRRLERLDLVGDDKVEGSAMFENFAGDEECEPHWKEYQDVEPRDLLALIGERLDGMGS